MTVETISGYRFTPAALDPAGRQPGISAFLRTRNGADFVEATIRSHIGHFDEIVAVFNRCDDATPDILARLAAEFAPRLRVFHYIDPVHPPGSPEHAAEPPESPRSLVAYSNCALALTTRRIVTKLDDDHLAISGALAAVCADLRHGRLSADALHGFSGPNLMRTPDGRLAIPAADPISGSGDIGFFAVSPKTRFVHDRRFERFDRGPLKRRFAGFLYWHLKYLKTGGGFANYELGTHGGSRFARKRARLHAAGPLQLAAARGAIRPPGRLGAWLSDKLRFLRARDSAFAHSFPHADLEAALDALSPGWRSWIPDAPVQRRSGEAG